MSFFNSVYGDQELSPRAKMVCLYLHDRANKDGESWYATGSIARDLTFVPLHSETRDSRTCFVWDGSKSALDTGKMGDAPPICTAY